MGTAAPEPKPAVDPDPEEPPVAEADARPSERLAPTIRIDSSRVLDPGDSQELTAAQVMAALQRTRRAATSSTKKTRMAFRAPRKLEG
jgi:hypothetical protein